MAINHNVVSELVTDLKSQHGVALMVALRIEISNNNDGLYNACTNTTSYYTQIALLV